MPNTYRGLGIECLYPDNWKLLEDDSPDSPGFTLESPDAAIFSLTKYPWTVAPREAIERAIQAVQDEYPDCEVEWNEADLTIADSRSVEIRFFLLDLLVVIRFRGFSIERQTYLVQQQAEDRDYDRLEIVFDAILESVIQSIDRDQGLSRLHEA